VTGNQQYGTRQFRLISEHSIHFNIGPSVQCFDQKLEKPVVDYKLLTLAVYMNDRFARGNQHQQRIMKINNSQKLENLRLQKLTKAASDFLELRKIILLN
jgi:hypothetical protein